MCPNGFRPPSHVREVSTGSLGWNNPDLTGTRLLKPGGLVRECHFCLPVLFRGTWRWRRLSLADCVEQQVHHQFKPTRLSWGPSLCLWSRALLLSASSRTKAGNALVKGNCAMEIHRAIRKRPWHLTVTTGSSNLVATKVTFLYWNARFVLILRLSVLITWFGAALCQRECFGYCDDVYLRYVVPWLSIPPSSLSTYGKPRGYLQDLLMFHHKPHVYCAMESALTTLLGYLKEGSEMPQTLRQWEDSPCASPRAFEATAGPRLSRRGSSAQTGASFAGYGGERLNTVFTRMTRQSNQRKHGRLGKFVAERSMRMQVL